MYRSCKRSQMFRSFWPLSWTMGVVGLSLNFRKMGRGSCFILVIITLSCLLYISLPDSVSTFGSGDLRTAAPVVAVKGSYVAVKGGEVEASIIPATTKPLPSNFPRPTEHIYQELPFRYLDLTQSYQTEGQSVRGHTSQEAELLAAAKSVAEAHIKAQTNATPHNKHTFISGRYRVLGGGVEHDLVYKDKATGSHHRVTLYQKLEPPRVITALPVNKDAVVNVVVALQGRLDKYSTFVDHLSQHVIPKDPNISLTIVYFNDTHQPAAVNLTRSKFAMFPGFKWKFIFLDEPKFSRGRGLDVGAKQLELLDSLKGGDADDLLFFCDVDVLMQPGFLSRCRSNSRPKLQVYYPVVFSLYNPALVYPLLDRTVPALREQLTIDQHSGFWRTFGYGMACVYRQDYLAAGGYPDYKTWGGEDEALFKKFLSIDSLKVIRAPEPGLFHLYHHKDCSNTDDTSYPACLKSKAVTEGSQIQLGLMLLKLQNGTDLEGVLSKRFYYFWLVPYLAAALVVSVFTNIAQALLISLTRR